MIDEQIQEVLDLLNSELHGSVDYNLFSKIFDAVATIDVPKGFKLVPVELSLESVKNLDERFTEMVLKDIEDYQELYKALISVAE